MRDFYVTPIRTEEGGLWVRVLRIPSHFKHHPQTKTGDLYGQLVTHQHIGKAQDAMYNPLAMRIIQARYYLFEDIERLLGSKARLLFHDLTQRGDFLPFHLAAGNDNGDMLVIDLRR